MINTQTIRRPMLALIAGSAMLLGGAAMPKFCLQNPTMLYVVGEVRMALGDHDGGLRMIGNAAEQKEKAPAQMKNADAKPAANPSKTTSEICTKKATTKPASKAPLMVAYRQSEIPSPNQFVQLAKLENVDFVSPSFDEAKFEKQMRHAAEARGAAQAERMRHTLSHVRVELERRGIAVPPSFPEPPMAPITTP